MYQPTQINQPPENPSYGHTSPHTPDEEKYQNFLNMLKLDRGKKNRIRKVSNAHKFQLTCSCLNPTQRGVFLECIFGHFFGAPLNLKMWAICFNGLMGSKDIFRKSQEVSAHSFERKGAISLIVRLGGHDSVIGVYLFQIFVLRFFLFYKDILVI
jgi:hypothetical protein